MNKEELEKEAEEYKEIKRFKSINDDDDVVMSQNKWLETLKQAYIASAEPREKRIADLEEELEQERKINEEIKVRFVKCSSCTEEMKDKCLMFSENLCEGERCEELVDLVALVNQSELQNKCSELEEENAELKAYNEKLLNSDIEKHNKIVELEKENKELKEKLKPENCLKSLAKSGLVKFTCENGNEHDQLTKAIEIITNLVKFDGSYKDDEEYQRKSELYDEIWEQAEQFLKETKVNE